MELLNIKEYTKDWKAEIAYEISKMAQAPTLSIYQVGDNEASNRYVRNKLKDCEEVGIRATHKLYDESVTEEELMEDIYYRDNSNGIIVQLPLPPHIDAKRIARAIPVEKDVDGFREGSPFMCCTPGGIIQYLDSCGFRYEGDGLLNDNERLFGHVMRGNTALCNLKNGNTTYEALPYLVRALYDEGDIDRAYAYLMCTMEDANTYPSRRLALDVSKYFPVINASYTAHKEHLAHHEPGCALLL